MSGPVAIGVHSDGAGHGADVFAAGLAVQVEEPRRICGQGHYTVRSRRRYRGPGGHRRSCRRFDVRRRPSPEVVDEIVSALRDKGVSATFFVVGSQVVEHPEAAQALAAAGHQHGNHSFTHQRMWMGCRASRFGRDDDASYHQLRHGRGSSWIGRLTSHEPQTDGRRWNHSAMSAGGSLARRRNAVDVRGFGSPAEESAPMPMDSIGADLPHGPLITTRYSWIAFISRNSSRPATPISRPIPDRL
ncbi:polysaccharide deacetylase family protein [Gordonia sp. HNM0687]|uniref:Polysaccharide deacetylase family protein n=1 Tax=Gordonia mangrovi TaxID=2665643 RepID=A0A6L7GV02_9ACTN|nr:polysaccharide deacetylase family protein [Gordonia mangrovi]